MPLLPLLGAALACLRAYGLTLGPFAEGILSRAPSIFDNLCLMGPGMGQSSVGHLCFFFFFPFLGQPAGIVRNSRLCVVYYKLALAKSIASD